MTSAPMEVAVACAYWVLVKAEEAGEGPLTTEEVARRCRAMTEAQVREARALDAEATA